MKITLDKGSYTLVLLGYTLYAIVNDKLAIAALLATGIWVVALFTNIEDEP